MPRELLKFREGDCGLKIKKDGSIEVAGVDEAGGMIDNTGKVNPALLFAAAWARKDQKVFEALIQNFKDAVGEGFFGNEAQTDYKKALKAQEEHTKNLQEQNILNENYELATNYYLVFLGDIVDRGPYGIECLYIIYLLFY